jgi:hypothetical protein
MSESRGHWIRHCPKDSRHFRLSWFDPVPLIARSKFDSNTASTYFGQPAYQLLACAEQGLLSALRAQAPLLQLREDVPSTVPGVARPAQAFRAGRPS